MKANYGYKDGSGEYYITIDTELCNSCSKCVEVCPVDCCILDHEHSETHEQLLEKWRKLHPGETPTAT